MDGQEHLGGHFAYPSDYGQWGRGSVWLPTMRIAIRVKSEWWCRQRHSARPEMVDWSSLTNVALINVGDKKQTYSQNTAKQNRMSRAPFWTDCNKTNLLLELYGGCLIILSRFPSPKRLLWEFRLELHGIHNYSSVTYRIWAWINYGPVIIIPIQIPDIDLTVSTSGRSFPKNNQDTVEILLPRLCVCVCVWWMVLPSHV